MLGPPGPRGVHGSEGLFCPVTTPDHPTTPDPRPIGVPARPPSTRPQPDSAPKTATKPDAWATAHDVIRKLGPASVLAAGAMILPPLGSIVLFWKIGEIGAYLRGHGQAGVAMYVTGFTLFAGLALLPTYASAILGGWAFGFSVGFPAALAGFLGGAILAYVIVRPTASSRVENVIAEHPKWRAVRDALVGRGVWRTFLIVALLRCPPNSPFAMTNLVLAGVRVPIVTFALGTLVGMIPRTGIVVYMASLVAEQSAKDAARQKPWWIIAAGIATSIIVLGILGAIANKAMKKATS